MNYRQKLRNFRIN